jgi:hypothetical protein
MEWTKMPNSDPELEELIERLELDMSEYLTA